MSTRKRKDWRNTGPAIAATRARSAEGRERVQRAIHDLTEQGIRLSFAQISKASGVSRATLYTDDDVRSAVESGRSSRDGAVTASDPRTKKALLQAMWGVAEALGHAGQDVSTANAFLDYCRENPTCGSARRIMTRYREHMHALNEEGFAGDHRSAAVVRTCLDLQNDWRSILDTNDTDLNTAVLESRV